MKIYVTTVEALKKMKDKMKFSLPQKLIVFWIPPPPPFVYDQTQGGWVLVLCFPCLTDNSIAYDFLIFKKSKTESIIFLVILVTMPFLMGKMALLNLYQCFFFFFSIIFLQKWKKERECFKGLWLPSFGRKKKRYLIFFYQILCQVPTGTNNRSMIPSTRW